MHTISIVTDASSDLPKDLVDEHQIFVIPIKVLFGREVYDFYSDWGSLSKADYYTKLRSCKELPTTAVASLKTFFDVFEEASADGNKVLGIFASSKLTAIYQNAKKIVKQMTNKDITVIDSQVAGPALGLLVLEAARLRKKGATVGEIVSKITEMIPEIAHTSVMNTLENVYRSGRVSFVKKFMGQAFKIKPVIHFRNGETCSGGTLRGREQVIKSLKFLAPKAIEEAKTDFVFIWHTQNIDTAQEIKQVIANNSNGKEVRILEAGPVIGTHLGEKMLGIIYIGKYEDQWLHEMKN
jgi:DegV family protein with EDD domain